MSQQAAKAELEKYKRALVKEVGDEVPLQKLLDEASGAKGRAQQIHQLKDQVKSLNRKLERLNGGGDDGNGGDGTMGVPPTPSVLDGSDERQRGALNQMEQDRRREHERILLREQELDAELVETRKKLTAMDARIKNLEADVKGKKEKLKLMIEKSDSDDKLIEALRALAHPPRRRARARRRRRREGPWRRRRKRRGDTHTMPRREPHVSRSSRRSTARSRLSTRSRTNCSSSSSRRMRAARMAGRVPRCRGRWGAARRAHGSRRMRTSCRCRVQNAKLRELVQLLQEKLADAEMRGDGEY